MNETIDGIMGLDQIEMEDKLESILQKRTPIVTTNDIALMAGRKRFDIDKERALIAKASTTKCACKHYRPLSNGVCTFRNCRHGKTHFVGGQ